MKVAKETVKVEGLTTIYEPEDFSETGLDIIFVHGLGGHPVDTWLRTTVIAESRSSTRVESRVSVRPVRTLSTRTKSLMRRNQAPHFKKRGNTLKKRPPGNRQVPPTTESGHISPRPQTADSVGRETPDTQGKLPKPFYAELSPVPAQSRPVIVTPSPSEDTARPNSQSRLKETFWPLDLLPESCPSARIHTFGFETHKSQGNLSIGQLDIFARGGELLEAVGQLRRGCETGREMVLVAHSTGGLVVKEMLRLASDPQHPGNEWLLSSIASVIFMGCPLRGTDYGSMVIALKSMAAATTGVPIDDGTMERMLGGDEDAHLTYLGRDVFEALWREYNFRVKVYRETTTESPSLPWAELGLALRRDSSTLGDNTEEDEDILGDHVNMCRFESRRDDGYQRVSSYLNKLAHYHVLKSRQLTTKELQIQHALSEPAAFDDETRIDLPYQKRLSEASLSFDQDVPQWLLQHPKLQSWLRWSVPEDRHKLLWLSGPIGSNTFELLSTLRAHLARRWAPETHSSVIITITADGREPLLDSVVFGETDAASPDGFEDRDNNDLDHVNGNSKGYLAMGPKSSVTSPHETPHNISPMPNTPVRTLRSLLSQLYTHDPRLRNLVRRRIATVGPLHYDGFFLVETLFPVPNFPDPSKHDDVANNADTTTTSTNKTTTNHLDHLADGATDPFPGAETELHAPRHGLPVKSLDDADVWTLFWEDYLCLGLPKRRQQHQHQHQLLDGQQKDNDKFKISIPSIRRVFILVDATGLAGDNYPCGLLRWLRQLATRSEFSVCVASTATMLTGSGSSRSAKSPSDSMLLIQVPEENAEEIRLYLDNHLVLDMEERPAIADKMLNKAAGVMLWAEMVTKIVNDASEEGVSGEIVLSMLDDIAPGHHGSEGLLDDLFAWKLRRLSAVEQAQALAVMQWVMLAPEPLRLNELLVALRLTLLACRRGAHSYDGRSWDISQTLVVDPAISLKELRAADTDAQGIGTTIMDSPSQFWKWLHELSQGLLRLESEGAPDSNISSEPLGLQRVRPAHESVHRFFLKGRGFQTLLPTPFHDDPHTSKPLPSTERFIDTSYYTLLHVCLVYLNITELDALGREKPLLNPAPGSALPPMETSKWRAHTDAQRRMVMSSYPLLRYAVDHLVFHLLCPRQYRYFLPQGALLSMFAANRCRIWRRWTHLLGFSIVDASPEALLAQVAKGPAGRLLAPVYGARYRLERVLRRVWRMAMEQQRGRSGSGGGGVGGGSSSTTPRTTPRRTHFRSRSDVSEGSMVFMLMGGEDPLKASWMVPTSPGRTKGGGEATPRALAGIEETGGKEGLKNSSVSV